MWTRTSHIVIEASGGLCRWRPLDLQAIQQCFGRRLASKALLHLGNDKPGQNNGEMMRASVSSLLLELDQTETTTQPVLFVLVKEPERRCPDKSMRRRMAAAKDTKTGAKPDDGSPWHAHVYKAGTYRSCQAPRSRAKALKNGTLLHFFEGLGKALPEQLQSLGSCKWFPGPTKGGGFTDASASTAS